MTGPLAPRRPVRMILVPYDSGHRSTRMGAGPERLAGNGAVESLRRRGTRVDVETVEAVGPFPAEISTAFELQRLLAERVGAAKAAGAFPLVLAGNCISSLGTVAGLGDESTGVIWLDAHGDFNTPDTTTSGFLDGMGLATLTGRCWRAMAASVAGFRAVPEARVILVGTRDLDVAEGRLLEESSVTLVTGETVRTHGIASAMAAPLAALRDRARGLYLHVDLDVLDPAEARANALAPAGGLRVDDVLVLIAMLAESFTIAAAALTAFDPAHDRDGQAVRAGIRIIEAVADAA